MQQRDSRKDYRAEVSGDRVTWGQSSYVMQILYRNYHLICTLYARGPTALTELLPIVALFSSAGGGESLVRLARRLQQYRMAMREVLDNLVYRCSANFTARFAPKDGQTPLRSRENAISSEC
jgi:hypothetical protein